MEVDVMYCKLNQNIIQLKRALHALKTFIQDKGF